ncbi:MAG: hypothetical protein JNL40_01090 [Cyclobacteriaceae bacterium]|nr:hypothetical protein [Cyclobacteriaceae bacterium]
MNKLLNHLNLLLLAVTPLIFFGFCASGQTITKNTTSVVSGTVCPGSSTSYSVSIPSNFGTCKIKWTVTNGVINGADNQQNVSVTWNDTPGATSTITVTFSGCTSGNPNEGVASSKSELILSVKNQAWDSYGSSINVDYCTKAQVLLMVPRMFVLGTGGIAQPPLTEVAYAWTLPSGWKEVGTNRTGFFGTPTNFITIIPIDCAKPGNVTVYGTLVGAGPFCNSAEKSATATISLNGANPIATVGPQSGYTGSSACNITPVTFYGTTNVALGCISSYSWAYPQSWSLVSQSGNSITLRPSGTSADSNPIRVSINFTCGSSITSGNYIPPYTQPIIDGPNLICSSGTFTIQNSSSTSVTWTSLNTSVLTINSSGIASRLGSASGSVTQLPCFKERSLTARVANARHIVWNNGLSRINPAG